MRWTDLKERFRAGSLDPHFAADDGEEEELDDGSGRVPEVTDEAVLQERGAPTIARSSRDITAAACANRTAYGAILLSGHRATLKNSALYFI